MPFCVCLFKLSLRCIFCSHGWRHLPPFKIEKYPIVCRHCSFFIHSPIQDTYVVFVSCLLRTPFLAPGGPYFNSCRRNPQERASRSTGWLWLHFSEEYLKASYTQKQRAERWLPRQREDPGCFWCACRTRGRLWPTAPSDNGDRFHT